MTDEAGIWVDTPSGLAEAAAACTGAPTIAIDTESNSLHAYREKVCFVQLAAEGRVWLIDTVALRDLSPLTPLLADRTRPTIVHGADYDVVCLRRDFGLRIGCLFDTMIASQILGYEQFGLAALLLRHFGLAVDKSHTRHDWGARPLDPRVRPYLVEDVRHLNELASRLQAELEALDRVEEAEIEFDRVAALEWNGDTGPDSESFRRIKGARELDHEGLSILRELQRWRERAAEAADRPLFKVLGNEQLLAIASQKPRSPEALGRIRGVTPNVLRRSGRDLLQAVLEGRRRKDEVPFRIPSRNPRRPDVEAAAEEALKEWRRGRMAAEGKPSLVILPNHALLRLAAARPESLAALRDIEGLGEKRARLYGAQILDVLRGS